MKYLELRREVVRVNQEIVRAGLVVLTWGNASATDRKAGVMAIKPSGVDYTNLRPEDIVVLALADGRIVEGKLRPSSDTPTHLYLYQQFAGIGGIVHTHSVRATAWAQAGSAIPCFGTTHADNFHGPVPLARKLTKAEVAANYELNTGVAIVDTFRRGHLDPLRVPGVLMPGHAPFAWGRTAQAALENAIALEAVAGMALDTLALKAKAALLPQHLLDKHFLRKHGAGAYYGQK
ncbi:MAG: L-ribulose-5-phosphate 4-epimerase AraD [Kiritimatiellaeota bacterium]|nr:L-ribulose-5-phosphate 4-epimerase AraD [Kiritimatiellota bacterium]